MYDKSFGIKTNYKSKVDNDLIKKDTSVNNESISNNYIAEIPQEIFEMIIGNFTYNPTLANLSMTSKELQLKVLGLPCGEYVQKLKEPSYLKSFLAKDYSFAAMCYGGIYLGIAVGGYLNYETILSTYLGILAGGAVGGAISSAMAGYLMEGIQGVNKGTFAYINLLNVTPIIKMIVKMNIIATNKIVSYAVNKEVSTMAGIIKEQPKKLLDKYQKNCLKNLSIFKEINRSHAIELENDRNEIQQHLSQKKT
ncbi:MAG: hypothetical protein H0U57_05375 [Tatlockia sp.]|nr:hypothetical protein [Tatlockia sp.]